MHIRKGLSTDLARLECCDFSFTVEEIAREPFLNGDLHIEALTEPYLKTYELDLQTLENHCVNPDSIFLIAETDDGEIAVLLPRPATGINLFRWITLPWSVQNVVRARRTS